MSGNFGNAPVWSPNGRELFYQSDVHRIMAVSYSADDDSFRAEKPRVWAEVPSMWRAQGPKLGVTPDGKRFAVQTEVEGQTVERDQRHVTMLSNFFDELRRRAPAED